MKDASFGNFFYGDSHVVAPIASYMVAFSFVASSLIEFLWYLSTMSISTFYDCYFHHFISYCLFYCLAIFYCRT